MVEFELIAVVAIIVSLLSVQIRDTKKTLNEKIDAETKKGDTAHKSINKKILKVQKCLVRLEKNGYKKG